MAKKYSKNLHRGGNCAFFLVLGGVFVLLGILSLFFWEKIAGFVCIPFGVLLAVLPQTVIFSGYGLKGDTLVYAKGGIPRKIKTDKIGAVVVCIHDEYRRGKGFVRSYAALEGGGVPVPALCFFTGVDENELDLCASRTQAKMTFRKEHITDAYLDFDFLQEFSAVYTGSVYVFGEIYQLYEPALKRIFGEDRVTVYDRVPKKLKPVLR